MGSLGLKDSDGQMAEQSVTSFLKIQTAKVYDDERGLNVVRNLFFVSTPPLGDCSRRLAAQKPQL